jgi:CBS domain containing-hemolysin-like protein
VALPGLAASVLAPGRSARANGELTRSHLAKDSSEKLSGLIYSQLGRVAAAGDVLETGGLRLKVEQVLGRRIRKVHAVRLEPREATEAREHGDHANPAE